MINIINKLSFYNMQIGVRNPKSIVSVHDAICTIKSTDQGGTDMVNCIIEDMHKTPTDGNGLIYIYSFDDGTQYVGQTTHPIIVRHKGHIRGTQVVDRYIRTHDSTLRVIEETTVDKLFERERFNILKYNTFTPMGWNLSLGDVSDPEYMRCVWQNQEYRDHQSQVHKEWFKTHIHPRKGIKVSAEAVLEQRQRIIQYWRTHTHPCKGKHHSDDTKTKISIKSKQMWATEGFKEKHTLMMSEYWRTHTHPMTGKTHTIDARKKMSDAKYEQWQNQEYRDHQSQVHKEWFKTHIHPNKGRQVSEETRKKQSESQKRWNATHQNNFAGMHHTDESRMRMKEGKKKAYEKKIQKYLDWEWWQTQKKVD